VGNDPSDARKELLELDDPSTPVVRTSEPVPSGLVVTRATVRPTFDPEQFAEDSEIRERMPTFTDEAALEDARLQSLPSNVPPARRPMSTVPGPLVANPRDSAVEIDTGEADIEALDAGEQTAILSARLAPLSRVPVLLGELTDFGHLLEDPKTAYVLGFIDGILPLETIVEVTGLPELDTLRVLDRMVAQGVVFFRPTT
jgi:hypothetical protein